MNRRERRRGRMYLLPLLLGLTGIALLVLEWVLRLQGADGSAALDAALRVGDVDDVFLHGGLLPSLLAAIRPALPILILPVILLILYLCRIPPKAARIAACVIAVLFLIHLIVVLQCGKHDPSAFALRVPGHSLLVSHRAMKAGRTVRSVLSFGADLCFLLSTFTAVCSTLIYSFVKARSDRRNAEFDRRNAYLNRPAQPQPACAVPVPEAIDEAEDTLLLPEDTEGS